MSYRTVFLHCLMQSEMLFCMHRSGIWCLFSISFMLLTLILLIYSLLHLRLFFSAGKIRTTLAVLSHLLKEIGVRMWSCTTEIRRVLLLNECTDTSSLCCRKTYVHLPLSDLYIQYPEALSTLHCSQVQLELKENGFSEVIPQHGMQLADTYAVKDMATFIFMQCMTESRWICKGVWSSEVFQHLNSHPFKRSSVSKSILKTGALDRT